MKRISRKARIRTFFMVCLLAVGVFAVTASAAALKMNQSSAKLYKGQTVSLSVSGLQPGNKVKWKSSKKSVATVNQSGLVTAKKTGQATITAQIGKKKVKCKVTVKKSTISLNKKKASLYIDDTLTLKPTVKGKSQTVKWSSSKSSVASVDSNGRITAKKKGTATITAKANGVKVTCKVTVKKTYTKKQAEKGFLKYVKKQDTQKWYWTYEGVLGDEYVFSAHFGTGTYLKYYINKKNGKMYEEGPYFYQGIPIQKKYIGNLSKYL